MQAVNDICQRFRILLPFFRKISTGLIIYLCNLRIHEPSELNEGASVILTCVKHLHQNVLGESSQEYFKFFLKRRTDKLKPSPLSACTRPSSEAGRTCRIKKAEKAARCNRTDTLLYAIHHFNIGRKEHSVLFEPLEHAPGTDARAHQLIRKKTLEVRTYSALIHSFALMQFVLVCACGCLCSFSGRSLSAHSIPPTASLQLVSDFRSFTSTFL